MIANLPWHITIRSSRTPRLRQVWRGIKSLGKGARVLKTIISDLSILEVRIGTDRLDILSKACPELVSPFLAGGKWRQILVHGGVDERFPPLQRLLKILPQLGLRLEVRYTGSPRNDCVLPARRERKYDRADFDKCELLWIDAKQVSAGIKSVEDDVYCIDEHEPEHDSDIRHATDFANIHFSVVCSTLVRRVLEASDLRGLQFRETFLLRMNQIELPPEASTSWEKYGEPWWQIQGTVKLPPLAPSVKKIDTSNNNAELPRETVGGISYMDDPEYSDYELHYLRSELDVLGPFDVASSYETQFGARIIVSKRFFEIVCEHGFECNFRPVRIDED